MSKPLDESNDSKRYVGKVQEGTQRYVRDVLDENARLRQFLTELETTAARRDEQYAQIEQQNANLANLYVASYQLAGTVDRATVLQSIQEIVANLIGSEEIGIWERNGDTLVLAASFGIDAIRMARIPIRHGRIGATAASGEIYVSPTGAADDDHITACIPLRVEGEVIGVVTIFELLGHKPVLGEGDRELFDLLAVHAATSLYCSTLHAARLAEVAV
jgi:putative methionine-R-sulfoxide reductase with GAF domain